MQLLKATAMAIGVASFLAAAPAAQSISRFVLARVTAADGQPILGLTADDFVVYEGTAPSETINATPASYPVAVLIDTSHAARAEFGRMRDAARQFVDRLSGRDVALYAFGDRATRVVEFTRDAVKLRRAIDTLFAWPDADSHVLDAIVEAAREISRRERPVSLIVVVSAGSNDQSNRTPKEVFEPVLASRSIVHVVEMRTPRASGRLANIRGRRSSTSDRSTEAALGLEELLRGLADRTQGGYTLVYSATGYQGVLDDLQRSLASEVVIEYASSTDRSNAPLKIGTRLAGANVRGIGLEQAGRER